MTDDSATPSEKGGFCPSCGNPRQTGATYCTNCGNPLTGAGKGSSNRATTWVLLAVVAAFMVIAATIAVLTLGGGENATAAPAETTTTALPATTTHVPSPTTTVVRELDEKELADSFGSAVFKITTDGCEVSGTGSGFAIGANHIVTNRHVVENDTTPMIVGRDGSVYDGRVVGWRENPDMAVIWIADELDTYLKWADSDRLSEGERIVSLGYPLPDHDFSVAPGVVLSFDEIRGHREGIRTDAQLDRGNSGGPTLIAGGGVAGVVTAVDLNLDGFQIVPIILPSNDIEEKVGWILENPSRPTVDCDEILPAPEPEAPATTTTIAPPPPPPVAAPESFFSVILSSWKQEGWSSSDAERERAEIENRFGYPTYLANSNIYPSLTPGLWVVHIGSMDRQTALRVATDIRTWGGFEQAYAKEFGR
jgi:hypothetical protein